MMQEKLYRTMLICSILLSAAAMTVMLYFSATKTIVIAEEAAPGQIAAGERHRNTEENMLCFQEGTENAGLRIPLPSEVRADDIIIENRYIEHSIHIILSGRYGSFYKERPLISSDARVKQGVLSEENGITRLKLQMTGLYEHQYMFENGELELSFVRPQELYDKIVVLDAAHGGTDSGSTGHGVKEKELTLELTEKIRNLMEGSGIRVYCTRTDDTGVSAEERTAFVNELHADMLVSVRVGADETNDKVYGIQTFYNGVYFIPYFGNIELADLLERSTVSAVGGKANGLFEADEQDVLLRNVQIPAAAIEVGYLTNSEEAGLLSMDEYKIKLAEGIAEALRSAFERKEQK